MAALRRYARKSRLARVRYVKMLCGLRKSQTLVRLISYEHVQQIVDIKPQKVVWEYKLFRRRKKGRPSKMWEITLEAHEGERIARRARLQQRKANLKSYINQISYCPLHSEIIIRVL